MQLGKASENSHFIYGQNAVQLQADAPVSHDGDWLEIFAVVHSSVNQVALFMTCRLIFKLTPLLHIAGHNLDPG